MPDKVVPVLQAHAIMAKKLGRSLVGETAFVEVDPGFAAASLKSFCRNYFYIQSYRLEVAWNKDDVRVFCYNTISPITTGHILISAYSVLGQRPLRASDPH